MRFSVAEIKNSGVVQQSEDFDASSFLGAPPQFIGFPKPLHVEAEAQKTESEIVLHGTVTTGILYTCARCLENFERKFEADFHQIFSFDQEFFDISNEIREAVFIDLPIKSVCRDDCKGLCPTCGVSRNVVSCRCEEAPRNTALSNLRQFPFK